MTSRAFMGAGDLYLRRYVSGAYEDWSGPYECDSFQIKPNVELKEKVSKGRSTYGQVIESVAIPKPADLTVSLSEVNKESLAIALMGTVAALSQGSGTLTDEVVTAKLDKWVALTKANWSGAPTVTNSAQNTTYVAGTDYIYNSVLGMIKCLSTGAIVADQSLKADVSYSAISGSTISGMTDSNLRCQFKLDGKNFADGLPCIVTVYEAVIAASAAFDFLGNDFTSVTMPGRMKTPVGYNEPFIVQLRNA